ncbi:MAG: SemiSWEET family sugar transporter [Candidatus Anammoxibacter sp.]
MIWQIIGIIASITVTCGFIPQIIKAVKTKKLDDVSPGMYMLIIFGMVMWILYGFHLRNPIIIAANVAGITLSTVILWLRFKYKAKK